MVTLLRDYMNIQVNFILFSFCTNWWECSNSNGNNCSMIWKIYKKLIVSTIFCFDVKSFSLNILLRLKLWSLQNFRCFNTQWGYEPNSGDYHKTQDNKEEVSQPMYIQLTCFSSPPHNFVGIIFQFSSPLLFSHFVFAIII